MLRKYSTYDGQRIRVLHPHVSCEYRQRQASAQNTKARLITVSVAKVVLYESYNSAVNSVHGSYKGVANLLVEELLGAPPHRGSGPILS